MPPGARAKSAEESGGQGKGTAQAREVGSFGGGTEMVGLFELFEMAELNNSALSASEKSAIAKARLALAVFKRAMDKFISASNNEAPVAPPPASPDTPPPSLAPEYFPDSQPVPKSMLEAFWEEIRGVERVNVSGKATGEDSDNVYFAVMALPAAIRDHVRDFLLRRGVPIRF